MPGNIKTTIPGAAKSRIYFGHPQINRTETMVQFQAWKSQFVLDHSLDYLLSS